MAKAKGLFTIGQVRANIDAQGLADKYKTRSEKALAALTLTVVRDTDPFVPFNTGQTADSAMTSSDFGRGLISYDTEWATKIYHATGTAFSRDHHAQATDHWFEAARKVHQGDWVEKAAKLIGGQVKR